MHILCSTKGVGNTAPDPKQFKTLDNGVVVPMGKPKKGVGKGGVRVSPICIHLAFRFNMVLHRLHNIVSSMAACKVVNRAVMFHLDAGHVRLMWQGSS